MSEETETGDRKEPMNSETVPDMIENAQEAFFTVEDFVTGALEYLKSLLPA